MTRGINILAEFLRDPAESANILISDYYSQPFGYAAVRPDGTNNWLLTYTLDGSGEFRVKNQLITCETGDVVMIPPNVRHDYRTAAHHCWKFHWVHFTHSYALLSKVKLPETIGGLYYGQVRQLECQERIDTAFRAMHRDLNGRSVYRELLALNSLELIVMLFAEQCETQQRDPRVEQVTQYLIENFRRPIRIGELATLVSLSPSRLSHIFANEVGVPISQVLLNIRLRFAANRLKYTSDSIGRIAGDAGFSSVYYFSERFHRHYGTSPTGYRRQEVDA